MNGIAEWLEADGLGGFASGTTSGIPARRYHSLLTVATRPPLERVVLVNAVEAILHIDGQVVPLSSFKYESGLVNPDASALIKSFDATHMPTWTFEVQPGKSIVTHKLFVPHESRSVVLNWELGGSCDTARLLVRPLISGRDFHSLHRANPHFCFDVMCEGDYVEWTPYPDIPRISAHANGNYNHQPLWYYNFLYQIDLERGFPATEDLAAPGYFEFDLKQGPAQLTFSALDDIEREDVRKIPASYFASKWLEREIERRKQFSWVVERAADAYIVRRGAGKSIIAGYPWFSDWGRDTFIALRGLCFTTGRLQDAHDILIGWSSTIEHGMLPNRFPEQGETPDFNSVDAALWFVIAAYEYLKLCDATNFTVPAQSRDALHGAIGSILTNYENGTLYSIGCDSDGLLRAGQAGTQLTWMDAKIGNRVITPRIGKPVEIQALWINALAIGARLFDDARLGELQQKASASFENKFWNPESELLYDVIDVNHQQGEQEAIVDLSFRPNQILAVGGLPFQVLTGTKAEKVVAAVEKSLLTPVGLRSLSPEDSRYIGRYQGNSEARDSAYHQGTVWVWLLGPFVEAWVRVRGNTMEAKAEARHRFLQPFFDQMAMNGTAHAFEIADGDAPHTPRGTPCQAWSVGELLRLDKIVLV